MTAPGDCLRTTDDETRRPVRSLRPSKPRTGPAPPPRSACAPGTMALSSYRGPTLPRRRTMGFLTWLRERIGADQAARCRRQRTRKFPSKPTPRFRPRLEALEDRLPPGDWLLAALLGPAWLGADLAQANLAPR